MVYNLLKIIWIAILWLDLILFTLFMYTLSFLPKKWTSSYYSHLFQSWCWAFIRALGVNLKLHEKNQYPLPKHFILIGNHPSLFEDLGMPALFKARFLAKRELKDWWFVGRMSVATGTLYVKRESKESRKKAREQLIDTLKKGHNIALYPEGGCKGRRLYLPFYQGVFEIALTTNVPILPVFLHYEAQEAFEWKTEETVIQKLRAIAFAQNKTVNYYIYDAIDPKQFQTKEAFCEYVQNLYLLWQTEYLE